MKQFYCNICNKEFQHGWALKYHSKVTHGNAIYKCDKCNKRFSRSHDMIKHSIVHSSSKPEVCELCGNTFAKKSDLKRHINNIHVEKTNIIKCLQCNFEVSKRCEMNWHVARVHEKQQTVNCPICEKEFNCLGSLKTHTQTSHDKIRYQCDKCEKDFSVPNTLKDHLESFHNRKRLKCHFCDKHFNTSTNLRSHVDSVHSSSVENIRCELCGKSFNRDWETGFSELKALRSRS